MQADAVGAFRREREARIDRDRRGTPHVGISRLERSEREVQREAIRRPERAFDLEPRDLRLSGVRRRGRRDHEHFGDLDVFPRAVEIRGVESQTSVEQIGANPDLEVP